MMGPVFYLIMKSGFEGKAKGGRLQNHFPLTAKIYCL